MELSHLHEYAVLADTHSFTLAARKLGMTQSALSKHIAALEREFDTDLFTRSTKGVTLTSAGQMLYAQALEVGRIMAAAKRAVKQAGAAGEKGARVADTAASTNTQAPQNITDIPASDFAVIDLHSTQADTVLRARCRVLAARFELDFQEQAALVLFLEEAGFSAIQQELGLGRDGLAEVLASAYRKMGVTDKAQALALAKSISE